MRLILIAHQINITGQITPVKAVCEMARARGIEIALDFAVQCSLDHPWIKEHPEWFE